MATPTVTPLIDTLSHLRALLTTSDLDVLKATLAANSDAAAVARELGQLLLKAVGKKKQRVKKERVPTMPKTHWSVSQISERWERSDDFVRDWFAKVPGIMSFDRPATKAKHRYFSFVVPNQVLLREETRLQTGGRR